MFPIRFLLTVCVALAACAALLAAQTTGAIEGAVYDSSGVTVPGAFVVLHETETGAERKLATGATGRYLAPALPPGVYRIEVSHPGFRRSVREGVELDTGQTARIDFYLQLGEAYETVVVTAEPPLISTSASSWSVSTERHKLESLPLYGRDLFDLSTLEPGAAIATTAAKSITNGMGTAISVNGARPNQNSFRLDGIYINDATSLAPSSAAGRLLGLEGIRELHLVTSPFSAEYGRAAGAILTAVSKSGANDWHGSLYEFFRNSTLDAKNFFDDPVKTIPPLRKNQFGGVFSGPVHRNRLFFLANYEGIRKTTTRTESSVTLSAEARQGRLPGSNGIQTLPVAAVMRPYLDLYPLPNGRDFGDGTAEFVVESPMTTREDYAAGKIDILPSDRLRFSSRYTLDDAETLSPDPFHIWAFRSDSRYQFIHNQAQYIGSPDTIHVFRAGFSRVRNTETSSQSDAISPSLSFVKGQPLGSIRVVGLSQLGPGVVLLPRRFVINDFQLHHDVTHIRGSHTIRLGGGYDRIQFNQRSDLMAVGSYRFDSVADFLTARTRSADVMAPGSDTIRGWRLHQFFAFVQDEVRLHSRLSLSLGVRYEASTTPTEVNGKIATLRDPLSDATTTVGGPLYRNPSKRNFAPRAALAWDPSGSGKTAVRAGAGIFFDLIGTRELVISGVRMPPFFERLVIGTPPFPDLFEAIGTASPQNSPDGLDFCPSQPYVIQFQFSVQRRLDANTAIRVGYAGARGIHLSGQLGESNPATPVMLSDGRLYFPEDAPRLNPAFGRIKTRRMLFNSFHNSLLAGLQRKWRGGVAFQASYTLGKLIDETSSTINKDFLSNDQVPTVFNFRQNRGLADFDIRHVFTANVSYEIPIRGSGVAGKVLGGWEIHGLLHARTGHPFSPEVGFDRAGISKGTEHIGQRPDYIAAPGAELIFGDPQRYFDPYAFGLPEAGFYGNLGRNTLTGPGLASLDVGLHKVIWKNERHDLRFRLELLNATNHPNFQKPSDRALFNSRGQRLGSAGRITETSTTSRQIQIAAKWVF